MKKRPARKHSSSKNRSKRQVYSFSYVYVGMAVILVLVFAGKMVEKTHVLGQSVYLAQGEPPPGGAPASGGGAPPSSGGSQPAPQSQPQSQPAAPQQSQPQPQQPSSNQQSQPQSQPAQQGGQQPNAQQQQMMQQGGQQQYQPKTAEEQKQYQQYMQQTPEQQKQAYQQYQQQGQQQRSQQYQGSQQQGNQQYNPSGAQGSGIGNTNQQVSGPQGSGPGANSNPNQQQGPTFTPEQIKLMQQYEQQFKQEAAKSGIQFSGSLPPQVIKMQQQYQQQFQQQGGSQNNGSTTGTNNTGQNQNQNPQTQSFGGSSFQALPSIDQFPTITGKFEVQSRTGANQKNINLNDANTRIQLGAQNYVAKNADGTQAQIDKSSFEKINSAMQIETGAQFQQTGDQLSFKRGDITAQTTLPIAFNMSTKTFTVQTANGEKQLSYLPDQAVEKLIQNKIISQVNSTTSQGGNTTSSSVKLTEFQNQPVFEVQGTVKKKFLGFAPVSIPKTSFVSAESGNVVNTNQGIFSRALETISF